MHNVSLMEETLRKMRKHGSQTVEVTQSLEAFGRYKERLPRGRYFVGKKPGRPLQIMDDFFYR
ncbi:TPA: hypothetical protein ORR86_003695 [Escherichia coli]|nr:hypothetical protein [Escherichia coli]